VTRDAYEAALARLRTVGPVEETDHARHGSTPPYRYALVRLEVSGPDRDRQAHELYALALEVGASFRSDTFARVVEVRLDAVRTLDDGEAPKRERTPADGCHTCRHQRAAKVDGWCPMNAGGMACLGDGHPWPYRNWTPLAAPVSP
jgi:hypothetical protein